MDDSADGRYSRAPEFEDLIELCRSLNKQQAQYLLIGGFAVILHGSVRGTKDIDLLVEPSAENVKKIKAAMASLPDNAVAMIEDDEVEKYEVVRIADEIVVDLMAKACGVSYEEAKDQIEWREIEGVKIPVAGKELLIRLKQTPRPSDQSDVLYLQERLQADRDALNPQKFKNRPRWWVPFTYALAGSAALLAAYYAFRFWRQ